MKRMTRQYYIRQGQLLHNVFASIRQESDLPQAIERLRFEGILESAEQEQQIYKLVMGTGKPQSERLVQRRMGVIQ